MARRGRARPGARVVAGYIEHWQAHAAAFRARNLASDEGDARFSALRVQAVSPLINAMAVRIEARQQAGRLPADLQAASLAGALLAMVERLAAVAVLPVNSGITRSRLFGAAAFFAVLLLGDEWEPSLGARGSASDAAPRTSCAAARPAIRCG